MAEKSKEILNSKEFKTLVKKRWTVAFILTALEFAMYYGYILLISLNKPFMSTKIGKVVTICIPIGVAVIAVSFVFTAIYIIWANNKYDPEVKRLSKNLKEGKL